MYKAGKDGLKSGNLIVPAGATLLPSYEPALRGRVNMLHFNASVVTVSGSRLSVNIVTKAITAIPYFNWNNRGANDMRVWLPTSFQKITINE